MVYHIETTPLPWLFALCAAFGIALQLLALFRDSAKLSLAGLAFALFGAWAERDLTLAVGALAASAAWLLLKRLGG